MTKKNVLPDGQRKRIRAALELLRKYQIGPGFWGLLILLLLTSFTVTFELSPRTRAYVQGEIAEYDIMADRSFDFRDNTATRLRREAVRKAQPVVCTLNMAPADDMIRQIKDWFLQANRAQDTPEEFEKLRAALSDAIGEDISPRQFALMADQQFQTLVNNIVLPWLEERLREGVVDDVRKISPYSGGVIIRNLETGSETVLSDIHNVMDIKDLQLELDNKVRNLSASMTAKKLIISILSNMAMSTLTINDEATRQKAADAARAVEPVMQHISEGEIIVRQGEKISAEQLVKLNALWQRSSDRFKRGLFFGLLGFSLLMSAGLFFSPNGRKMSFIRQKDMVFIGVLLLFMVLLAKGFYAVGHVFSMSSWAFTAGAQAFAVPVAGAAGLTALSMSSKRYYTMSMMLSLLCTIVCKGGIGLFFFYFIGSMLCAWLVMDTQNRKEVVWSILPLTIGLVLIWLPSTLLQGGEANRFLPELVAVVLGSTLSMVIIFALSPVVEMLFGFTTRFSLMELMNQEHEILQELMLEAPGTYHHSIIVANMAEMAAKAIGAHSLLCKVGGIYHDIGKIEKAAYFIENQFKIANPHDRLTPAMSALVLISHVKRGVELAHQHKLGPEITDIIRQHHGTSVIRYFYHKAKELNPNVQVEDFSYNGPKPQSREAALIMLADVVEASSRTLADPTPSRIRTHVENIVQGVFAAGQLDSTELTFKDLDKVTDSFVIILTGIFHKRIEYPEKVPPKPSAEGDADAMAESRIVSEFVRVPGVEEGNYNATKWLAGGEAGLGRRTVRRAAPIPGRVVSKKATQPKRKRPSTAKNAEEKAAGKDSKAAQNLRMPSPPKRRKAKPPQGESEP